jgi:hypothetical protein
MKKTMAQRQERQPDTVCGLDFLFFLTLEGGGKIRLGNELRREEQRLSRTGVCVD